MFQFCDLRLRVSIQEAYQKKKKKKKKFKGNDVGVLDQESGYPDSSGHAPLLVIKVLVEWFTFLSYDSQSVF